MPEQSLVATKFRSRFPNTIVVTEGKPSQWPMTVFTAEHHKDWVCHLVFSPDESTFASISGDTFDSIYDGETMCVCDSETGHCISGPFELSCGEDLNWACFSPDGKHILLDFESYAIVLDIVTGEGQFLIEGLDFAFIRHDRRIASTHWIDEDGNSIQRVISADSEDEGASDDSEDKDGDETRIVVKLWDASSGSLISNRLFVVNETALPTQFSPDGRLLAIARKPESVIELWSVEDGTNL